MNLKHKPTAIPYLKSRKVYMPNLKKANPNFNPNSNLLLHWLIPHAHGLIEQWVSFPCTNSLPIFYVLLQTRDQVGIVVEKVGSRDVRVQFAELQKEFTFNSAALEPVVTENTDYLPVQNYYREIAGQR